MARNWAVLLGILALGSIIPGCASAPTPISLGYQPAAELTGKPIEGVAVAILPFEDARTNQFLFNRQLVLEPGADAGVWVANAMTEELARAGADVARLSNPDATVDGYRLSGAVHVLQARQTGWSPGGILGAATAGLSSHLEVTVELVFRDVPQLNKGYRIDHRHKTDPLANFMFGANPTKEVPQALPAALQELICAQILPDIMAACARASENIR